MSKSKSRTIIRIAALVMLLASVLVYRTYQSSGQGQRIGSDPNSVKSSKHRLYQALKLKKDSLWSRASLTIHSDAGPTCELNWIKSGKACNIAASTIPPLDLLWIWQNNSDAMHLDARRKKASPDRDAWELPEMDTLKYSLRSGQANLGSGFGNAVILSADMAAVDRSKSPNLQTASKERLHQSFNVLQQLHGLVASSGRKRSNVEPMPSPKVKQRQQSQKVSSPSLHVPFIDETNQMRIVQKPSWLKNDGSAFAVSLESMWAIACKSGLIMHDEEEEGHHQSLGMLGQTVNYMRKWSSKLPKAKTEDLMWTQVASYACKQRRLPTFNPEVTRAVALDYESQSDAFVLLEKRHFFGAHVTSVDFYSPLFGPIFRLAQAGVGEGEASKEKVHDAHIRAQISSNALLGRRFGHHDRPGLLDLPVIIVKDLMQEVRTVWRKDLLQASLNHNPSSSDIDVVYLYTHYTIERHREALLWSFIVAKHDLNGDNKFSSKEAHRMLEELGLGADTMPTKERAHIVYHSTSPRGFTPQEYRQAHSQAGVPEPAIGEVVFTSLHGTVSTRDRVTEKRLHTADAASNMTSKSPPREACRLVQVCFEPLFKKRDEGPVRPSDFFKHVTFAHWGCGDCIIHILNNNAGSATGLAAFLPSSDLHFPPVAAQLSRSTKPQLPLQARFETADYSLDGVAQATNYGSRSRLDFVVKMLMRYQYAIAEPNEPKAIAIFGDESSEKSVLIELEKSRTPIYSMRNHAKRRRTRVDELMSTWLALQFAEPLQYE
ncbi:hypothetical protein CBS101457_004997 [Exobasidium rhododendri]|nr:hypothetical protein CBS101457_004997 [Exobasidium rhododendri]